MTGGERRQIAEGAQRGSIIDAIGVSLERFNGNLSDDRKIKLFAMKIAQLKKLAIDVERTQTGFKAISQIVAAIATSDQEPHRDEFQPCEDSGSESRVSEVQTSLRRHNGGSVKGAGRQKRDQEIPRGKARPR